MPIARKFLGGQQPALAGAVDYLLGRYAHNAVVDLSNVVVVVPAGRAGRRLLEILVQRCGQQHWLLQPPIIETIGAMPEQLYAIKKPLASDLTQQLAWAKALAETSPKLLAHVLPQPPAREASERWFALGVLLQQQYRELASDRLDFAGVAQRALDLPGFDEEPRWQALADVQTRYFASLDALGQWDRQAARLYAIKEKECRTERDFVLVAVADMNRAMRAMLDQVASHVTALIAADPAWNDRFDEHGCLIPSAWREAAISIADEQVVRVDGPADQAYAVAEALAELGGKFPADDITIGLADEALAPQITRQLAEFGVSTRFINDKPLSATAPFTLLTALVDYLHRQQFSALAALVRHPDFFQLLEQKHGSFGLLSELDALQTERLPLDITGAAEWFATYKPTLAKALAVVESATKSLLGKPRPIRQWIEPVQQFLMTVYGQRQLKRLDPHDRVTIAACEVLQEALMQLEHVPAELSPIHSAASTLELVLQQVASQPIPPLPAVDAIEMLGWLELPLDDAPALIVTTFNEGFVPSSHQADLFLPNRLRNHLGLSDSDRLYARDAYAVSVLLATRKSLKLIVGRRDRERNPLAPSRLLFAADQKKIAQRALRFFCELPPARPKLLLGGAIAPQAQSQLLVPPPVRQAQSLTTLRVTDFRSYLACPYRFYLRRVLRLESVSDASEELDGGQFGNLLHHVLQLFGNNADVRGLTSGDHLADYLATQLYLAADEELGTKRRPTVNVQIEQLRLRLVAFAQWQAARTQQGWQIDRVEVDASQELEFGPHHVTVQGRIDRIDYHPGLGEWMVLDYKSGDAGDLPKNTHRRKGEWIDLQLPLYRRLARHLDGITSHPQVGYILLPKDTSAIGEALADWNSDDWNSAEEAAARVVAGICEQQFWPPNYDQLSREADLAAICQELVAGRQLGMLEEVAL